MSNRDESIKRNTSRHYWRVGSLVAIGGLISYLICSPCFSDLEHVIISTLYCSSIMVSQSYGHEWIGIHISKRVGWLKAPIKSLGIALMSIFLYTAVSMSVLTAFFYLVFGFGANFMNSQWVFRNLGLACAIALFIHLIFHVISFLKAWREEAVNAEKLKAQILSSQYEALRNQVNPHFLFNSFNVLSNLVYEDQEKAVKFIQQLSQVYRYVLESRKHEMVELKDELDFIKSYAFLQKVRFGENLHLSIDIPRKSEGAIAPLSLQMLIENAIKHNIISSDKPLMIEILTEKEGFITVRNKLQKKNIPVYESSGLGLQNIKERYKYLSDRSVEIIEDTENFSVLIPTLNFN
ncbi:sensor histidine kinase [Xanthovirga aplysinae]|uniref:sensor histidine kinase n=1 Tax=Xanthovirga aplysinae TaxID=2529853 RepID=UPI0012BB7BA1|nr:histidine kinase [Xanthovirga aplysinae]MTI32618.1 histidine kinase [Xanthovirga aplysinae]